MRGYHLHNNPPDSKVDVGEEGEQFVKNTLIKNLREGKVKLPDGPNGELVEVPIADLGISDPVVVTNLKVQAVTYLADPVDPANVGAMPTMAMPSVGPEGGAGVAGATGEILPKMYKLRQYDFVVQFCWQPQPRSQRVAKMAQKKAPAAATPEGAPAEGTPPATAPAGTAATGAEPAAGPSS